MDIKNTTLQYLRQILTSTARLRTRSALSRRNHVSELSANYSFKADAIHVSLSRIQTLYTIKQVTLVSATRLTFNSTQHNYHFSVLFYYPVKSNP